MVVVLMGVAGSGKTTVGRLLSERLGWRFDDADSFHPAANIAKMSAGQPLDDGDRAPWLAAIRAHLDTCEREGVGAVVTCSALKQRYRDVLLKGAREARLVYLKGTPELLQERISGRQNHFMSPGMLASQLAALEEPVDALVVGIADPAEVIVENIRCGLGL